MVIRLLERRHELREIEWKQAARRAGTIAAVIANTHRDPKKQPKPFMGEDFFPELKVPEEPRKKQTWEEQLLIMKAWSHLMDGNPL